jgi:8-amino-7-oxononanoate synthase
MTSPRTDDPFQNEINALKSRSLHRRLRQMQAAPDGTVELNAAGKLINFASNDYLGLADDPLLREAAKAAIDRDGVGAGASRLVSGTRPAHGSLEEKLARFKGTEAALTFSSGYAAAAGVVGALVDKHDVLILDKLCHACLVDAARASGAVLRVFPHNALGKLEDHLQWARREHPDARVIVLTEAVFSMDGDRAPLAELVELKTLHGALLLLDEAHAVGVIGKHGRGLAAELGLTEQVDIHLGTMSKALGVSGGYIAGSRGLIDLLVNRARTFIYSTAQPPALAAAAEAAVDFLQTEEGERRRLALWQNIRLLGSQLPPSPVASTDPLEAPPAPVAVPAPPRTRQTPRAGGSAIFPWIIGAEHQAIDFSAWLAKKGFFAPAIRYPTVPNGSARLRLTVTARHRPGQIMELGRALGELVRAIH